MDLIAFQYKFVGNLHPFAVDHNLEAAAFQLLKGVGAVGVEREAGGEILAAEIIDDGHICHLAVLVYLRVGDQPEARVAAGSEISGKFPVDLLSGNNDIVVIEVHLDIHLVLTVVEIPLERFVVRLRL